MTLEMSENEGTEDSAQDYERYVTLFKLEQEQEEDKWIEKISGFLSTELNEVCFPIKQMKIDDRLSFSVASADTGSLLTQICKETTYVREKGIFSHNFRHSHRMGRSNWKLGPYI